MKLRLSSSWNVGCVLCISSLVGCGSQPRGVSIPSYDPAAFASSLLDRFDADNNDKLSEKEAAAVPGMVAALPHYDKNRDSSISREELAARATEWVERGDGLVSITCSVRLDGARVAGARETYSGRLDEWGGPARRSHHTQRSALFHEHSS